MSLFVSSITGRVLDDGSTPAETIEIQGVTAGQVATILTQHTPLETTTANTANIGANAAALAALQTQVAALPAPLDLTPYALAADLAAAEGSIAANQSSLTALSASLTTGLVSKANQSALDALQLEVAAKSTPASVDTKLQAFSNTTAMNSAIASANNATLASVASNYALRTVTDQLALDLAAKQSGPDVDKKIATALLDRPSTTDLTAAVNLKTAPADVDQRVATALLPYTDTAGVNSLLAVRDAQITAADAAIAALQAAGYQTAPQVASAIATALLPHPTQAILDAALALRDARLDGHDSEILALQSAGPFASSSDLTAAETSLQSAIDAILAQLAALTAGGGTNLINAQAWPGEITWDWLVGTNQIRNLHVTAPLSVSTQNDNFTLPLSCDAYSIAQADAAIAAAITAALMPYETAAQRDAAITAALAAFSTTAEVNGLIAAALTDYSTTAGVNSLIATALAGYSTTAQVNAAIATAVGGIDLSNYYERAETFSQAEVNSVVSGAIDALNITQYRTESQVSTAISDALVPYYTASEVDAAIASNSFNAADYFTRTQSDSRYFPNNANPGNAEVFTLVRDSFSIPRQIRGILPRAPLAWSYLLSGTITELRCDAYSKAEADGRYLSSTGYTGTLHGRYLVTNANAGSSEVFTIIRDANAVPRQLRGILPRAPLGWSHILSGTVTELTCDAWSKTEADGRYATAAAISAVDSRVTALENSGGVPADISCTSLTASSAVNTLNFTATGNTTGVDALFTQDVQTPLLRPINVDDHLRIAAGLVSTRMVDNDGSTVLAQCGAEVHMRVPTRCDYQLTIDDVSGPATGLLTNAVSARIGDDLLTINGGTNKVTVLGADLAVAGVARATTQVRTSTLIADFGQVYLSLQGGTTGTRVLHASNNEMLKIEADETQCLTRVLSVTNSASASTTGLVIKNTATTGTARLQLDANTATGFAQLEVAGTGNCTLNAPGQEIWLQNRLTGQAPLIVETHGIVTTAYGQNDLSDEKVKQNIRDADLDELQTIFDRATPKRYDRADVDQKDRLGFLAQDLQNGGVTGKTMWGGEELLSLDYGKLTAVLWGVCKRLQARVEALEKPKKPKTRRAESPRGH